MADDDLSEYLAQVAERGGGPATTDPGSMSTWFAAQLAAVQALAPELAKARLAGEMADYVRGAGSPEDWTPWERQWLDRYDAITRATQDEEG